MSHFVIRSGDSGDADTLLCFFDEAVEWLVARGSSKQWGTEPWSAVPKRVERVKGMAADPGLRIAVVDGEPAGAVIASALSRLGARVVIGDLDQVRAEKTAGELGADALPLDVTDIRGFTAFLDEVERRHGPIDVLVNNAGIMPLAAIEEESDATTRRQLEIN